MRSVARPEADGADPLAGASPGVWTGRRVFVIKPSSLGDVVHALPAVHYLKRAHPHLEIRWVVNSEWAPLLHGNPDLAGVVPFPRQEMRGWRALPRALAFRKRIRSEAAGGADLVLDFQGLLRSALIGRAFRSPRLIGLSDAREGAARLYHETVPVDPGAHAVDRYLALPRALGISCPDPPPSAFPLPSGIGPAEAGFALPARFVVLHPFSRGEGKALSLEHISRFCRALAPVPVVVVGVRAVGPPQLPDGCVDLSNRTDLPALIGVLRAAAFTVSVDSGPMHIAAALGTNLIGIHTWTDPRKVGPYPAGALVWKGGRISDRRHLTAAECSQSSPITDPALDAIASSVIQHL